MVLSYHDLNDSLLETITTIPGYLFEFETLMELYYLTGCRPIEALEKYRWTYLIGDKIQLITAKSSGTRTFELSELPVKFVDALRDEIWLFDLIRISQASYYFSRLWTYIPTFLGDKAVRLYAFRYRYVKWLQLQGLTDLEIQEKMGWDNVLLASRYYGAILNH